MIDIEFATTNEKDTKRRNDRVVQKFQTLRKQNPSFKRCKLAQIVAKTEEELPDGVKTSMGVAKIIKKNGLWTK